LSESLHKKVRELARKEGISINQLITTAVAEKLSALTTEEYLMTRARRGRREKYDKALGKVRDVVPEPEDRP
jgi:hypothetical protein